jgi:hypothetical protein
MRWVLIGPKPVVELRVRAYNGVCAIKRVGCGEREREREKIMYRWRGRDVEERGRERERVIKRQTT